MRNQTQRYYDLVWFCLTARYANTFSQPNLQEEFHHQHKFFKN